MCLRSSGMIWHISLTVVHSSIDKLHRQLKSVPPAVGQCLAKIGHLVHNLAVVTVFTHACSQMG